MGAWVAFGSRGLGGSHRLAEAETDMQPLLEMLFKAERRGRNPRLSPLLALQSPTWALYWWKPVGSHLAKTPGMHNFQGFSPSSTLQS